MAAICPKCGGSWATLHYDGELILRLCTRCWESWLDSAARKAVHTTLGVFFRST